MVSFEPEIKADLPPRLVSHVMETPANNSPTTPIRLLLVEDDEDDAYLLKDLLAQSAATFEIETAGSIAEARKRLKAGGIDLVLSDLSLPDSRGIQTFAALRAASPQTPVIVLSGMDDEELAMQIVERGAQDYLVKGRIDCALLTRAIRYAIKRVEAERALAEERLRNEEKVAVYNKQLRDKNLQLEDDLRMASEVQQAFLPQQTGGLVRMAAKDLLRFYSSYLPSGPVGGDFFHILPLSDTTAGVFISDVMGHGVRAALVTALERALVEELSVVASNPGIFLSQINQALISILRRTGTPLFVSAFYLFADVTFSEIRYAVAGHPRQLIVRRSAGVVEMLPANGRDHGPALGVFEDQHYEMFRAKLSPGDLVLLFTDGLFEVEGRNGELFDLERLQAVVRNRMRLPPRELPAAVINDVKQFADTGVFLDDVCLVVMDFAGPPGASSNQKHAGARDEHQDHGDNHHPAPELGTRLLAHDAGIAGNHQDAGK